MSTFRMKASPEVTGINTQSGGFKKPAAARPMPMVFTNRASAVACNAEPGMRTDERTANV